MIRFRSGWWILPFAALSAGIIGTCVRFWPHETLSLFALLAAFFLLIGWTGAEHENWPPVIAGVLLLAAWLLGVRY